MSTVKERLEALAESLAGCQWNHPVTAIEDVRHAIALIDRLTRDHSIVLDLIDDVLYDPHFKPVDLDGNRIRGNAIYLVDHPVQRQHMPALREWFVKQYEDSQRDHDGT